MGILIANINYMGVFSLLIVIGLIIWIFQLQNRINRLEERNGVSETKETKTEKQSFTPTQERAVQNTVDVAPPIAPPPVQQVDTESAYTTTTQPLPQKPDPVTEWFKENTLIKVGAFIFFLGAVWFVSYAISQGWISPLMRILLGILLGVISYGVGHWRQRVSSTHHLVLTTLGTGIIIASIYAGQFLFTIFPPAVALILLGISIAYTVFVSIKANSEWLSVISAIAGFVAPLLINSKNPDATLFFIYLLGLSVAFLGVVVLTHWRSVTFTLLLGVAWYEFLFYVEESIEGGILWVFVLIFAALFYVASTVSLVKSEDPISVDLLTLGFTAVSLLLWTRELATNDGLATFIFALICAGTGYLLYSRNYHERLVAIYAGLATIFILTATSFTFTGFSLTLAYALEVTFAIAMTIHLRLPDRAVMLASVAYILPIYTSLTTFSSQAWDTSIFHSSAYSLYTIVLSTLFIAIWSIWHSRKSGNNMYGSVGGTFLILCWIYLTWVIYLVWGSVIESDATANVFKYLSWNIVSFILITSSMYFRLPTTWMSLSLGTLVFSVFASIASLTSRDWNSGATHPDAVGLYILTTLLIVLSIVFIRQSRITTNKTYQSIGGTLIVLCWLYTSAIIWLVWGALIDSSEMANVLRYVSWGVVSYALTYTILIVRLPVNWIPLSIATFTISLIASVSSFMSSAWESGASHPDAVGLYLITTLFFLLGVTFMREEHRDEETQLVLGASILPIFTIVGLYLVGIVWLIAHALLTNEDVAVSVALFIYTVAGLTLYTIGKSKHMQQLKVAGIVLLTGVIARLVLIEVWNMEMLGRIFTFLGIGLLFILTALFEKPFEKKKTATEEVGGNLIPPKR